MYYGDTATALSIQPRTRKDCEPVSFAAYPSRRLHESALFTDIAHVDRAAILAPSMEKHFARRDTLFFEGDGIESIMLLLEGCVKVTQLGWNGTEVILRLNVPGDVVGDLALMSRDSHGCTAQALYPCKVLIWSMGDFHKASTRFPQLQRNANQILGQRLQELEQRFRQVSTEKVSSRLAHLLINLFSKIGRRYDDRVEINLSREEMAQMIGTTLFTVSRLLSEWEQQEILALRRETVLVHRVEALMQLSEREVSRSRGTRSAG
jgi:CRP-like cAMP-binding protein